MSSQKFPPTQLRAAHITRIISKNHCSASQWEILKMPSLFLNLPEETEPSPLATKSRWRFCHLDKQESKLNCAGSCCSATTEKSPPARTLGASVESGAFSGLSATGERSDYEAKKGCAPKIQAMPNPCRKMKRLHLLHCPQIADFLTEQVLNSCTNR